MSSPRFERALEWDVRSLLEAWVEGSGERSEVGAWKELWLRREMSLLHHGPYRAGRTCPSRMEFARALFRTVLSFLRAPSGERPVKWKCGVIFALYTFYYTQPEPLEGVKERARRHITGERERQGTWRVPIRLTPSLLFELFETRRELVRARELDALAVLYRLFADEFAVEYACGDSKTLKHYGDHISIAESIGTNPRDEVDLTQVRALAARVKLAYRGTPKEDEIDNRLEALAQDVETILSTHEQKLPALDNNTQDQEEEEEEKEDEDEDAAEDDASLLRNDEAKMTVLAERTAAEAALPHPRDTPNVPEKRAAASAITQRRQSRPRAQQRRRPRPPSQPAATALPSTVSSGHNAIEGAAESMAYTDEPSIEPASRPKRRRSDDDDADQSVYDALAELETLVAD